MITQTKKTVRIIKRKINDNEFEGTATVLEKNGLREYIYDYPFAREIKKNLVNGDLKKISKKLGLSQCFITSVLDGVRFNEGILAEAMVIGNYNKENNYI